MYNSTAFGTFENLDIVKNGCSVVNAQSGLFCIFIAVSNVNVNSQEAVSFDLSSPLQAGGAYTLTFFYRDVPGFSPTSIITGVSSVNNIFGTLIDSIPASIISNAWTMRTVNFISPVNAGFITVTVDGNILNTGDAVDNFQLNSSSGMNDNLLYDTKPIIFPTLFSNQLNISLNSNELSEIILYDVSSRRYLRNEFINSASINTEQLAKGIYIYEVRNEKGVIKKGKIVKE
jgi:hypothetical protein